jgi:hypothetical protein
MKPQFLSKVFLLALVLGITPVSFAQSAQPTPTSDDKAEQIVQQAVQAMGGDRYLTVKTAIGRGLFTEFSGGVSQVPVKFVDYISYPDKERTEFSGPARLIQTNVRDGGWIYDGAALTIKDQSPAQLDDFKIAMRVGVENLLRGGWRSEGAKLSYAGRREATIGRRNETVRLTYPDGFWIEYEFSADTHLPAKVRFVKSYKNRDTGEMEEVKEEDRLAKMITIDGITSAFIIDHYRNGIQTSRVGFDSIEYNKPLADSLFTKPANLKAIK